MEHAPSWTWQCLDVIYDIVSLRVVLDTDVLFAAFVSAAGASRQLLLAALDGEAELLLSTALILEYEAVLTRPGTLKRAGIGAAEVLTVLDALAARVGAQAEAARYFAARGARTTPAAARAILARAGQDGPPLPGDAIGE